MASDDQTRVMWPFPPNWANPYGVSYQFNTEIFTTENGAEQRRALRSTPRKAIEFEALVAHDRLRAFNRLVDTAQNLSIVMPELTRRVVLVSVTSSTAAEVSAMPSWLHIGAEVVLLSPSGYILTTLVGIDGNIASFDANADGSLAVGVVICPALTGMLAQKLTAKRLTNAVAKINVDFNVDPTSEIYPQTVPPETFAGYEVVGLRPDWATGVDTSHEWEVETVDFGRGRTAVYRAIDFPTVSRTYSLVDRSSESMVELFVRMRGQRGAFFLSSLEPDLIATDDAISGAILTVRGTDTYYAYRNDPVRAAVEIYAPAIGTWRSMVSSIALAGADSAMTLVDPLPVIPRSAVARISWLTLSRFANDTFETSFLASEAVRMTMSVKSLPTDEALTGNLRATVDAAIRTTVSGDNRAVIYL